ncbi:hypothetical protein Salat_1169100 [Sesamum alatum]|uniref:DUF4283 domain-containing protein n=1 Tax=Sesamum alatum TaxID=300844 RepID=A0AAE1YEQ6_9LAMI|nr:hypothetical protein Salat_1169100 [Sesamum alatum]
MDNSDLLNTLVDRTSLLEFHDEEIDPGDNLTFGPHFLIITKILCDKTLNNNAIKSTMLKAWGLPQKTQINTVGPDTLAFLVESEEDRRLILRLTPWSFRGNLLVIKPWLPEKALEEVDLSRFQIWAHVIGLPIILVNKRSAQAIGDMIGKFVHANLATESHRWRKAL